MALISNILTGRPEQADGSDFAEASDRQLVDRTLAGDELAFENIFNRHKRHVAMVAGRYFDCTEDIDEVIQASFIKAYAELRNFRGEHEFSLVSWLGRIAATTSLNLLRSRDRKIDLRSVDITDRMAASLSNDLVEKSVEELISQRDLLEKILVPLDVDDRSLLKMLYGEEMTTREIGEVFGWSRAKVKVRAFRARRALKKVLKRFL